MSVPCDPATFVSLQICQHRARRRRSHTFLGGISHNCPFGHANCKLCHTARARDLRTQKTVRVDGGGMPWDGRDPHEKSMLPTHIPSCLFPYQVRRRPCRGCVLCSRSPLDKCSKSNLEQIVPIFWSWASDQERPGPTTHEEPHTGKMEWAEECQRSPKWPRGHACRRVRSPTILISVARGPAPVCAAAAGCVFARRPCVLSCLARTFARCVCRAAPGNEGQPGVPVPSDCWRPCTAALSVRLGRDLGVSQKPQLSFGDGLHGCSAASKTTRPGP